MMHSSTAMQVEESPKKNADSAWEPTPLPSVEECEQPILWSTAIGLTFLHVVSVYALIFHGYEAKWQTWLFNLVYGISAAIGVTAGLHRLWSHRSYSAKLPLRIFLALVYCKAGMTPFHTWIKKHRIHHKFTDTPADPHDATRGFFFAHVGWLMMEPHSAVAKYGDKIDMSDIDADPVIQFFTKFYAVIMVTMTFVIPTLIPIYFWEESWHIAFLAALVRYALLLNAAFFVNSFAHMFGNRPYNKSLKSTENYLVSFFALGEGWHNYHHVFPWDYKAAELPYYFLNPSTAFIELMALLGLAYDLKTPSKELVEKVSLNKGDGTASRCGRDHHQEADVKAH